MSGYAPLFSSLTTGTLCGKWPDIGLWPIVLSLSDWRGVVDVTPDYLSRVTGLPLQDVAACMARFCEPDPYSRSEAHEGRRLLLLEPDKRNWGWQVVNLQLYRDRASGQDQVADGRNAEKVRRYKERHRRTPADTGGHPKTPGTPGDTDSYSNKTHTKNKNARAEAAPLVLHVSLPAESWSEWLAHRREKHLSMSPRALNKQLKLLAEYPTAVQREIIDTSINAGWEGLFRPKGNAAKPNGSGEWT